MDYRFWNISLARPDDTQTFLWCLGLRFSVGSLLFLSLTDVPAKTASEANPSVFMLYHQRREPVLLMWEGKQTGPQLSPQTRWGYANSLEEALETFIIVLPP